MKKIKKINTAKRVKIILEQDETLVSHGGGVLLIYPQAWSGTDD